MCYRNPSLSRSRHYCECVVVAPIGLVFGREALDVFAALGVTNSTIMILPTNRSTFELSLGSIFISRPGLALLHNPHSGRVNPNPARSYTIAGTDTGTDTGTVVGHPSCVKRSSKATRTCNCVTWRSNVRAITCLPKRLKQCILVSTRLLRW